MPMVEPDTRSVSRPEEVRMFDLETIKWMNASKRDRCRNCGRELQAAEVLNCDVCRGIAFPPPFPVAVTMLCGCDTGVLVRVPTSGDRVTCDRCGSSHGFTRAIGAIEAAATQEIADEQIRRDGLRL